MRRIHALTLFAGLAAVLAVPGRGPAAAPPSEAVRADIHGDPLPPGAVARLGSVRFLHPEPIAAVAFSPGRDRLAVLTRRGEKAALWLWAVPTGKPVGRFPLPFRLPEKSEFLRMAGALAYSPDGRLLAVMGRERVHLLGARTGKTVRSLGVAGREVSCAAFSRDGRTIAVGYRGEPPRDGGAVALWDVPTGMERVRLKEQATRVESVAFSADGGRLFSATARNGDTPGSVCVWEVPAGTLRRRFPHPGYGAVSAPAGGLMAYTSKEDDLCLWDLAKGKVLASLGGDLFPYFFLPDGKGLVTEGLNEPFSVWEVPTGMRLRRIPGTQGEGARFHALSPDGRLLASVGPGCGSGRVVRLWDVAAGREVRALPGHGGPVTSLALTGDGRVVVTGSADGTARVWDVRGKQLRVYRGHERRSGERYVRGLALTADGRVVASGDSAGNVHLWDRASGKRLLRFRPLPLPSEPLFRGIHSLTFSADGKQLTGGCGGKVFRKVAAEKGGAPRWESAAEARLDTPDGAGTQPDVILGAGAPVGVAEGGRLLAFFGDEEPDGRVDLCLWRAPRGGFVSRLKGVAGELFIRALFSPDGRLVLVGRSGERRLFAQVSEVGTGGKVRELKPGWVGHEFSPDGSLVAMTRSSEQGQSDVLLADPLTGEEVARLQGHLDLVTRCAFSPGGRYLLSGSLDQTVLVWDLAKVRLRRTPEKVDASARGLEKLWAELASADAATGYSAVRRLAAVPAASVPLLGTRLRPVAGVPAAEIDRHVKNLASEEFAVRERASAALARLGELAEPVLGRLLADKPPLDVHRRAERLLDRSERVPPSPERRRAVRAVAVLERVGSAEARRVLEGLARGAPGARLTEEAKASLERLARRAAALELGRPRS